MNFGDKLSNLRKKAGLSQEELGEKLNVTRQTVSKWELGQSKPDTDKMMEISKVLNVEFNQLINNEELIENNNLNMNMEYDEPRPRKWLLILLIIIAIIIIIILANKVITDKQNKDKNNDFWGIFSIFNIFENFDDSFGNISNDSFNKEFEMLSGTKFGTFVSILLDKVITNNKTNSDKIITVVFDDTNSSDANEIKNLKKKLQDFTEYEVSIDYNDAGYVNMITIETIDKEEIVNNDNDIDVKSFNNEFEIYAGTGFGASVKMLLDNIITNNKTNQEHILKVVYGAINTTDENEIRNIKKNLDNFTEYEVIFNYDEKGYIVQITIES